MYINMINNFELKKDRYLFTDLFISENKIVFISMAYSDMSIKFENIRCYYLGKVSNFTDINIRKGNEST